MKERRIGNYVSTRKLPLDSETTKIHDNVTRKLRWRDSETTRSSTRKLWTRLGNYMMHDSETTSATTRKLHVIGSETTRHGDSETTLPVTRKLLGLDSETMPATRKLCPRLGNYGRDSETTALTRKLGLCIWSNCVGEVVTSWFTLDIRVS